MFLRLALLFVGVPLVELALLIQMGTWVGVLPTVALVVVTGILGAALARHQGLTTLARFQQAVAEGRLPHRELVEGILILVAGAVLLTPGLLTDTAGFLLLVPPARRLLAVRVESWLGRRASVVVTDPRARAEPRRRGAPRRGGDPEVVDVDFEVEPDD